MGTLREPFAAHPLPSVTVTSSWTAPEDPAANRIVAVPEPERIVPLAIDQAYVAPAPADGTEALLPEEFAQIEAGAEIADEGKARTRTPVVAAGEAQPLIVTVTPYVPEAEGGADRICGFCSEDANPPGPVQW